MTTLDAIFLGIVQGLTEFLPVSSSGHLKLFQYFLGMRDLDAYIIFDLACHLGTLLAIVFVFSNHIKEIFTRSNPTRFWQVILATLPLFPLVLLMKPIKATYANPYYLGFFFILTSIILFLGIKFGKTISEEQSLKHPWRGALIVGICQAIAIFPGVSRSGSTISGARLIGWAPKDAIIFSFLLAIPAILGGTILELYKLWQHPESGINLPIFHYVLGFFVSFVVGFFALQLLIRLAMQNRFYYFAWYCLMLGIAITYYFYLY